MNTKINALPIGKGIGVRKVLIHCSTLSEQLIEEDYFDSIISFQDLLDLHLR